MDSTTASPIRVVDPPSAMQTYVDDEFIFYSFTLSLGSVISFYPIIFLLRKQKDSKLGCRQFDQTLTLAIMFMFGAHYFAE